MTPLCLVAHEMRSDRTIRLWQDEFGPFPPYRLDASALIVGFLISAEFGCHIALNWGQPARSLDPYVEFRHHTNDGTIKSGDREKGFYGLGGALRYFGEDGIDTAHKNDMRDRIVQGPPFGADEREAILDLLRRRRSRPGTPGATYCADHPIAAACHGALQLHVGDGTARASRRSARSAIA